MNRWTRRQKFFSSLPTVILVVFFLVLTVVDSSVPTDIVRDSTIKLEAPPESSVTKVALGIAPSVSPAEQNVPEDTTKIAPDDQNEQEKQTKPDHWKRLGAPELASARLKSSKGFIAHRIIHFTFDDGPHPRNTPRLLDALDETGVKATFFIVSRVLSGPRSLERRAIVQRMEASGHTVANHTFNHTDLRRLSPRQISEDLELAETAFKTTLGYHPGIFRPPYGGQSNSSNNVVQKRGYAQVLWTFAPEYGARSAKQIKRNFSRALDSMERDPRGIGGVVLLHDLQENSVEAFPLLVEELQRRNCELLNQENEELWAIADDLRPFLMNEETLPTDFIANMQAEARRKAIRHCDTRQ